MIYTVAQLSGLFTAPGLAVAGAACVAIPIAIHLLSRSRRKRAEWGAMRFLRLAYRKQRRKLKLERWLLLATRCAVMLVAGLALAGPVLTGVWAGLGAGGASGRTVHIVLDDSLGTRAAAGEGVRFDRLRAAALGLIDGLAAGDAVRVWAAGRPGGPLVGEGLLPGGTLDHGAVRRAVEAMEPGYGASELGEVLSAVAEAVDAEASTRGGQRPPVVAVLSDWARGGVDVGEALPAGLGERASVVVSRPAVGSGNVQVRSVRPRRSLVLSGAPGSAAASSSGGGGVVSVEVVLRRLADTSSLTSGTLRVALVRPDGSTGGEATREVAWAVGQEAVTVGVDLPVDSTERGGASDGSFESGVEASGGVWSVVAEVM
ncbi:MAG: BatA domain-containing protein, partial [Planctomycetota bacterium]